MDVNQLEAGKQLDARVALEVLGWRHNADYNNVEAHWSLNIFEWVDASGIATNILPDFSTDISAAWKVVEKFPAIVIQRATSRDGTRSGYMCSLPLEANGREGQPVKSLNAEADTAPLAICRAALAAQSAPVSGD
jgi:hypothetical protein